MGEKMTLREVLDGVLVHVDGIAPYAEVPVVDLQAWADAITAHLTQPARAADVGAIQRVIDELRGYCEASDYSCYGTLSTSLVRDYADKLTAALPKDSNGAEGVGS